MRKAATSLKGPVLILGATSLIGRFLTPKLRVRNRAFHMISRGPPADDGWIKADLAGKGLAKLLPEAETVISLSPIWLLPHILSDLKSKGMKRLVAFSSTSVFTKAGSDDPAERVVAQNLANGEAAVAAFCEQHGIAWTILRPTLVYAEGEDQNISRLAALIRRIGVLPLAGRGRGLRQPVHAEDLAQAALDAAASRAARNRVYNLAGGETLTYRQMSERLFESLGRKPCIFAAPRWIWRVAFLVGRPFLPGATAQMGLRMNADLVFDDTLAKTDFRWNPRPFRPIFVK